TLAWAWPRNRTLAHLPLDGSDHCWPGESLQEGFRSARGSAEPFQHPAIKPAYSDRTWRDAPNAGRRTPASARAGEGPPRRDRPDAGSGATGATGPGEAVRDKARLS